MFKLNPDGSVTLIVPPGALTEPTYLSIAEVGTGNELTSNLGQNGFAVFGVTIEPEGTQFGQPATIIMRWSDEDNDGVVDGAHIPEQQLMVTKDNDPATPRSTKPAAS